jgi:hypothetical protein
MLFLACTAFIAAWYVLGKVGALLSQRDFLCYRFCRVDKGTVTATTPANLKLLALAPGSRWQSPD